MQWVKRLFSSWSEFAEYLVFLTVCVAGIADASPLCIGVGAMALLMLGWARYRELFVKAARIDAEYRELGALMRPHSTRLALDFYLKGHKLPFVLAVKLGQDCAFLVGAYLIGRVIAWVWFG